MFLDDIPKLHAHVWVDGQQLAEYDDEDTFLSKTTKSKYIEAVAGSTFSVRVTTSPAMARDRRDCLVANVYLDGKYVAGKIINTGDPEADQTREVTGWASNCKTMGSILQKMQFAQLQTTDAPVGKQKAEDFKHLGEVSVKCTWGRRTGETGRIGTDKFKPAIDSSVPEKCLKGRAISSYATLGPVEKLRGPAMYSNVSYPYGEIPIAVFIFKYRSRRDLQIEGVIPRSPSPVPLEERDPDDLSPEEARELVRRLRQREQERIQIKKEAREKRAHSDAFDGDSDAEELPIIGEGSARKRHRPSTDSGIEIVDLTED